MTDALRALLLALGVGLAALGWHPNVEATATVDAGAAAASGPTPPPTAARLSIRRTLRGLATWYCRTGHSACTVGYPVTMCTPPLWRCYAAAGPALRSALGVGWRGRSVTVASGPHRVTVRLVDWCSCPGGRLLDLYSSAFRRLAPLSVGVLPATVEVGP